MSLPTNNKWFWITSEALLQFQLAELKLKELKIKASKFKLTDLLRKRFWLGLKCSSIAFIEDCEGKFSDLLQGTKTIFYLIAVLSLGLLPLLWQFGWEVQNYLQDSKKAQVEAILEEAEFAAANGQAGQALAYFQSALKIAPDDLHTKTELAAHYLLKKQPQVAQKYLEAVQKSKSHYTLALKGLINYQQQNFKEAQRLLLKAYKAGLQDNWLVDALGVSLIAYDKGQKAFKLAGWPLDCQCNAGSHAACMERLSRWHTKVAEAQYTEADQFTNKEAKQLREKALSNQKRQIIFMGESMRSLLQAIEETDGKYRLELIDKFEQNKKELSKAYAKYLLRSHLVAQNTASDQLTPGEQRGYPI
jgi:hypothetical protein